MLPSFVHLYDDKSILHILTKEEYGFLIYAQMSETFSLRNKKKIKYPCCKIVQNVACLLFATVL